MFRQMTLMAALVAAAGTQASADQIVTITETPNVADTGNVAYDFFYTPSPGGEFTNYRLTVTTQTKAIVDPDQSATSDQDSDAIDTFANTVGSLFGAGDASYVFNAYNPTGFTPDDAPTDRLDWSVFDTLDGDSADLGGTPWHLARVLVTPDALGDATIEVFDTANPGQGQTFSTTIPIPEPGTASLLIASNLMLLWRRPRRKA